METLVISYDIPVRFANWSTRVFLFVLSAEFQTLIKVIFASASVLTAERMIKARNDVLMQYPSKLLSSKPMQAKRPFVRTYMFLISDARPAYISVHSRSSACLPLPSVVSYPISLNMLGVRNRYKRRRISLEAHHDNESVAFTVSKEPAKCAL